MKKKVVVLGTGRVGKVIAADLSGEFEVTSADVSPKALESLAQGYSVKTKVADLGDAKAVTGATADADLVICAVPGFMGFNTLKTVIEAGKDVVDISFFAEDAFELNDLAVQRKVTAVVDCGIAPGTPDYLAGYFAGRMQIEDFTFMVGGLHFHRSGPEQYLPTFSPTDVWEEYTRPARYVRDGKLITMPPLSEPELLEFRIGGQELRLEAFNTDGLRSLITTMAGRIPNMKEKTLRFPGHIAYIRNLQQTGKEWVPETWTPQEDEDEFTIMRIVIRGSQGGRPKTITHTVFVRYDPATQFSSMSRATGYSCAGVARCVLDGTYQRAGISPPSYVGEAPGCTERIFAHLKARGILFEREDKGL
ncbi:MAG TPA: saccharopine dehydrogenase C-terminal domain-containing protein [Acidobacteriaceae bacterium]|nr:saccharopine dehydrogenase C-terminal domain-containing protein [Acidobacteriaceae bacterium]